MDFSYPTYVCLDIPEPQRAQIQAIRHQYCARLHRFPVEITIAGSSGVGSVSAGQEASDVKAKLTKFCQQTKPFLTGFAGVVRFPNTDIFVLSMNDPLPFQNIHDNLRHGGIRFESNEFPFFPHCSLRMAGPLDEESIRFLFNFRIPGQFLVDTLSLYQMLPGEQLQRAWECRLGEP